MNDIMIKNVNDNNNDFEEIQVTLKLKKNIAHVGRLIAKHYDDNEDFDQFVSEEVSKMILALSTIPEFPDELKQQIQKLLKGEKI
jgi:hypothetical protein